MPDHKAIREALEQLLSSASFSRSAVQSKFLRFVVEQHLNNPNKKFSSFDIAADCFARAQVDDPNDAYVRNVASQTRNALKNHYAALAQQPGVIIQLADKGYLPSFNCPINDTQPRSTPPITALSTATLQPVTPPLAERASKLLPTLAVIPFLCKTGDKLHGIMGELMSDSLNTSLAKSRYLRVISRRSSTLFGTTSLSTHDLGEKLKADYIVEGSYFVQGDTLRVSIELCSSDSEEVIWREQLRSGVQAVIDETDDAIDQMLYGITSQLLKHELQRTLSSPLNSLQCHSLLIGGINIMHRGTRHDLKRAKSMLEQLVQRNPQHAAPYAYLAYLGVQHTCRDADYGETEIGREFITSNTDLALDRDSQHPIALTVKGIVKSHFDGNFSGALGLFENAIQLSPNEVPAMIRLSIVQLYTKSAKSALQTAMQAISISPFDPELYFFHSVAATAAFGEKKYNEAIMHGEASRHLFPNHLSNLRSLIGSYIAVDNSEMAKKHLETLLQIEPNFSLENYRNKSPFPNNEIIQRLSYFLGKSGLPISSTTENHSK